MSEAAIADNVVAIVGGDLPRLPMFGSSPAKSDTDAWKKLLTNKGIANQPHSGRTLLAHLEAVGNVLRSWKAPRTVILAGQMHSVYGSFAYTPINPPTRAEVKSVIGMAEELVHTYCKADLRRLRPGRMKLYLKGVDGLGYEMVTPQVMDDLLIIWSANLFEQNQPRRDWLVEWTNKKIEEFGGATHPAPAPAVQPTAPRRRSLVRNPGVEIDQAMDQVFHVPGVERPMGWREARLMSIAVSLNRPVLLVIDTGGKEVMVALEHMRYGVNVWLNLVEEKLKLINAEANKP